MFESISQWFSSHQTLAIQVFAILFVALVVNYFIQRMFRGLAKQLDKTKTVWDNILAASIAKPLAYFIALIGLIFALELIQHQQPSALLAKLLEFENLAVLVLLAWFCIRFVKQAEQAFSKTIDDPHELTTIVAIAKLARLAILITVALMAMQSLGYSIQGVLAFGGIGGIAIGFAAKDLLANFFGGLMIYLDRPFVVGDWVRSPDRELEGTVEHIGWRLTIIRTFDKRPLYIPNAVFSNIAIENPSRMSNRRIYETIGLRYDDAAKVDVIIKDVKRMLAENDDIDNSQTVIVNFNAFGASSLDFFIYAYTKTTDWVTYHHVKQSVLMQVLDIVAAHQAEVAFPTSTLHIQSDTVDNSQAEGSSLAGHKSA
ncbi:MAG: mechanosensitive ion channel family protein [Pseudomonadales bacterium]|nr:mechanosensitive ion channel family protein [Pseudomonadales bacterium]